MRERRAKTPKLAESLERKRERRGEERRESPRVPLRLWIRDPKGGLPEVHDGLISMGGVSWPARYPPKTKELEVGFRLPDSGDEVFARAVVMRQVQDGDDAWVQATFTEVDVMTELKLARWLSRA